MNPILEWMGVDTDEDLYYCMPNCQLTGAPLLSASKVFL
jgi:hypothetical protein